jgi:hypothetical protein
MKTRPRWFCAKTMSVVISPPALYVPMTGPGVSHLFWPGSSPQMLPRLRAGQDSLPLLLTTSTPRDVQQQGRWQQRKKGVWSMARCEMRQWRQS